MTGARVLLTGAFGNVGAHAIEQLLALGHEVHAFDLDTKANRRRAARLQARGARFSCCWGDLRERERVHAIVEAARPEVVLHVAAVIAPLAYVNPELARAVNVDGTNHLLSACKRLELPPRVVLVSSYTVHGPRNPHRKLAPLTGETPTAPLDNYGRHKVWAEQTLRQSGLEWTILRLPAVLATDKSWGRDPAFLRFFFLLPPSRREHLLDSRDAGLALARAVEADVAGCCFALGGPEHDCRVIAYDYHRTNMEALGLRPIPKAAFRRADPACDAAWYAEDWVDTGPSQAALNYQRHSFADYLDFMRSQAGLSRYLLRLLAPMIARRLASQSPFLNIHEPDSNSMAEVIRTTFKMQDTGD